MMRVIGMMRVMGVMGAMRIGYIYCEGVRRSRWTFGGRDAYRRGWKPTGTIYINIHR